MGACREPLLGGLADARRGGWARMAEQWVNFAVLPRKNWAARKSVSSSLGLARCPHGQASAGGCSLTGGLMQAATSDYAAMRNVAELLVPAIRWDSANGFGRERSRIARALELG